MLEKPTITRRPHGGEEHSADRAAAAMARGESGKATLADLSEGEEGEDSDESSDIRMSAAARTSEPRERQPRDPIVVPPVLSLSRVTLP